jgi:hypothetical protein
MRGGTAVGPLGEQWREQLNRQLVVDPLAGCLRSQETRARILGRRHRDATDDDRGDALCWHEDDVAVVQLLGCVELLQILGNAGGGLELVDQWSVKWYRGPSRSDDESVGSQRFLGCFTGLNAVVVCVPP